MKLERLFRPFQLGDLTLSNCLVCLPLFTGLARDGLPSQAHVRFYEARARGGAALICTESLVVHPSGQTFGGEILAYRRAATSGLRDISTAVQQHGAALVGQLWHCGRQGSGLRSGQALWAPSPHPSPAHGEIPREMSARDVRELVAAFAQTALQLEEAGFDGVEVGAAHGYLIHQFLSPLSNQRQDEYGGALRNRSRFLLEILDAIQACCRDGFVVGLRLSADEFEPGGLTVDDTREVLTLVLAQMRLDFVSISGGTHGSVLHMVGDSTVPQGNLVPLAAAVKDTFPGLPVIAAGRISDPNLAATILAEGKADLIGMARALLADPDLPRKASEGRLDDIRPCIACNQGCEGRLFKGLSASCTVNPAAGRESHWVSETASPTTAAKFVLVVGGGPAGMETARIAAQRGHRVELWERETRLGGQLNLIVRVANRQDFGRLVSYEQAQLARLGVRVCLERVATAEDLRAATPDVLVIATGARPDQGGLDGHSPLPVVGSWDILAGAVAPPSRVLLVDQGCGDQRLCTVAEFLVEQGCRLTILTPALSVGPAVNPISLSGIYQRLLSRGTRFIPHNRLVAVTAAGVVVADVYAGRRRRLTALDMVVLAGGGAAEDELWRELEADLPEVYRVGDCVAPRGLDEAVREAQLLASSL